MHTIKCKSKIIGGAYITKSDDILQLIKKNNGIITTEMIINARFSRGNTKYLAEKGEIEKTTRGDYALPDVWEDEFINLQNRFKKGIFSLETSLLLNDLTDRTPNFYYMTFSSTYNLTAVKHENVRSVQVNETLYELGVSKSESEEIL